MPDREKVIKDLNAIRNLCAIRKTTEADEIEAEMFADWENTIANVLELFKQEAIEPKIDEYGNNRCGACGRKLQSIADPDLFCCKCGRQVKWK